jgi:CheY-like chemotaxis protein
MVPAAPPLRILVIDDNVDAAEAMGLLLELAGHQVSVRNDGVTGIAEAVRFQAEVVFCDITMPGLDGYEVAAALRAHDVTREAHLVAVTGMVAEADRRRAEAAGFDGFLPKPFDQKALVAMLEAREAGRSRMAR